MKKYENIWRNFFNFFKTKTVKDLYNLETRINHHPKSEEVVRFIQTPVLEPKKDNIYMMKPAQQYRPDFNNIKLLTAEEGSELKTNEIISLYLGWKISDAITDKSKAEFFVSQLNKNIHQLGLPKIDSQSEISYIMKAMLTFRDAQVLNAVHSQKCVSDQLFASVDPRKTFIEANSRYKKNNELYFVSRDYISGEYWLFDLPKKFIDSDGDEIDINGIKGTFEVFLTTSLNKVKSIEKTTIKFDKKMEEQPGYYLEIDPKDWTANPFMHFNSFYSPATMYYDDSGRIKKLNGNYNIEPINNKFQSETQLLFDYGFAKNQDNKNWLGLLVAGTHHDSTKTFVNKNAATRTRDVLISAAHNPALPVDVYIDKTKIVR
jgi:hypothetical protein